MAYAGGQGDTPTGPFDVNDGEWHHLVAMASLDQEIEEDGVTYGDALYIDGQFYSGLESAPNLAANGQNVRIGRTARSTG